MAKKVKLRKLYVAEEATFGTDPSANGSLYSYLLAADQGMLALGADIIPLPVVNDRLTSAMHDVGADKATFAFKMPLRASGTPAGAGTSPTAADTELLLKHLLGAVSRTAQGATIQGGNASPTNILVSASTNFQVGGLVWCVATSEARFVTAVPDGTHVTLHAALSSTPTSGLLVPSSVYTPVDTGHKSLAFFATIDDVTILLLGCKCTGKISSGGAGQRGMLEVNVEATSYAIGGSKASLPAPNDTFTSRSPLMKGSPLWLDAAAEPFADFDFDFGVKNEFVMDATVATLHSGFEVTDREPKGSLGLWYQSAHLTDLRAGTQRAIGIAVGNQNNGWGLYLPKAGYTAAAPAERNELLGDKVDFTVYDNGSSPELYLSVF